MSVSRTFTFDVPEELAELVPEEEARQVAKQALVLRLVRRGRLGAGKGAELLGVHLTEFAKLMAEHGVAYFDYTDEEWETEERAVRDYLKEREGGGDST